MPKRNRDYKAEYAKRNANAKKRGYRSYGQQRAQRVKAKQAKVKASEEAQKSIDQMRETGLLGLIADEDYDMFDESGFWDLFREFYGNGSGAT